MPTVPREEWDLEPEEDMDQQAGRLGEDGQQMRRRDQFDDLDLDHEPDFDDEDEDLWQERP